MYNGQGVLEDRIARLLDVLSDLRSPFEVVIVDDGSTDHTHDLAVELSRAYPQVQSLHGNQHRGWLPATRTAMAGCRGDMVVIYNPQTRVSSQEFSRLWGLRSDEELVLARSQPQGSANELLRWLVYGPAAWGERLPAMPPGLLMIRRSAWRDMGIRRDMAADPVRVDRLTRTDLQSAPLAAPLATPASGAIPVPHWARSPSPLLEVPVPGQAYLYG